MMMTDQNETAKAPAYIVYCVKETADKEIWLRVGAGWAHGDKAGLNICINHLGQDLKLVIRPRKPKSD